MNDEEFATRLDCLNALYGSRSSAVTRWKYVEARKKHTDEFGDTIQKGEVYFRRHRGGFGYDVFKVSRGSMEKILELLFFDNQPFQTFAEELKAKLKKQDDKELQEAMQGAFDSPAMNFTEKPRSKPAKKPTNKKRPPPDGFKRIK